MLELMKKFMKDEEGQDLVEYALLLVFLALAAIAILPIMILYLFLQRYIIRGIMLTGLKG